MDAQGWQPGVLNLGLAYLASSLREAGHTVAVFDLNNRPRPAEAVAAEACAFAPDYIGFSVKSATLASAVLLHRCLQEACPSATFLYGGPHVTLAAESLLDEVPGAYLFRGEAEYALPAFVTRHHAGERILGDLPGLLYRDAEGQVQGSPPQAISDLDALPWPDFSVFDVSDAPFDYPLLTSRGCPYHCTYCSVPLISGSRWRPRSAESVLDELEHVVGTLKKTSVVIVDDNFTLHRGRVEALCRGILERGIRFTWSCANGIRADRLWPEVARAMVEAGCREVAFGMESWDEDVFAALSKGESRQDVRRGIETAQAAGLKVTGFFMIGLPGATYRKDLRTLAFARRLKLDNYYFGLTVPYPGTELWRWAQAHARFLIPWQNTYHISEVFREGPDRVKLEPVFETADYPAEQRRRLFQLVQQTKAGRPERSLRKLERRMSIPPGTPLVVLRSSARVAFLEWAAGFLPGAPKVLLHQGSVLGEEALPGPLREVFEVHGLGGEGVLDPEVLPEGLRQRLQGAVVLFDAASGTLERYGNVLALAQRLAPRHLVALLGDSFQELLS